MLGYFIYIYIYIWDNLKTAYPNCVKNMSKRRFNIEIITSRIVIEIKKKHRFFI